MNQIKTVFDSPSRRIVFSLDFLCISVCFSVYTMIYRLHFPYNFVLVVCQALAAALIMVLCGSYKQIGIELLCFCRSIVSFLGSAVLVAAAVTVIRGVNIDFLVTYTVPTLFVIILMYFIRAMYGFYLHEYKKQLEDAAKKPALIVGAGAAASIILRELEGEASEYAAVCIADDDPLKVGTMLRGIPVLGKTDDVPRLVTERGIDTIIIAIPSASPEQISRIAGVCTQTDCAVKILPSISKIISGGAGFLQSMKNINMEDLLGRAPIQVDTTAVREMITDKVCLVTGGGGSIGSELCRQIMEYHPRLLVIVDIYENNAYDIQQELKLKYGAGLPLRVEIASVRDFDKLDLIFERYKPQLVFHAAAHKHVPLMEYSAEEAVKNNVAGTYNAAKLAIKHGVSRFLLISTDKAVNPTNVMGATKRCCEKVIKFLSEQDTDTVFVTVRFGNVLGSNGSVVPLFEKQIESGGPITITHPDITRYFMTIPEAVSLVLQAETRAQSGQIFVLDMGKPVKIVTLAENLIKMHGLTPGKDIKIEFIGLREGEKLFEELRLDEEQVMPTYNEKIFIGSHIDIPADFESQLEKLFSLAELNDGDGVISQLQTICSTFVPDRRVHPACRTDA